MFGSYKDHGKIKKRARQVVWEWRDVYGYMMVHAECSSATVVVVSLNNYKPLL